MSDPNVSIPDIEDAIWAAMEIGPPYVFRRDLKLVRRKHPIYQDDLLVDCQPLAGKLDVSVYAVTEMVARAASTIPAVAVARVIGYCVALELAAFDLLAERIVSHHSGASKDNDDERLLTSNSRRSTL